MAIAQIQSHSKSQMKDTVVSSTSVPIDLTARGVMFCASQENFPVQKLARVHAPAPVVRLSAAPLLDARSFGQSRQTSGGRAKSLLAPSAACSHHGKPTAASLQRGRQIHPVARSAGQGLRIEIKIVA